MPLYQPENRFGYQVPARIWPSRYSAFIKWPHPSDDQGVTAAGSAGKSRSR